MLEKHVVIQIEENKWHAVAPFFKNGKADEIHGRGTTREEALRELMKKLDDENLKL